jgi:hypothetical protein
MWMETQAPFVWAASIIVLYTKALKNARASIVHPNRDAQMKFPHRPAQYFANLMIQPQLIRHVIKLLLSHSKCVGCFCHKNLSYLI